MKEAKFITTCLLALKHVKMFTKLIGLNKTMRHFDSLGFHGMLLAEMVVCDGVVVEVADFSHQL